MGFKLEMSVMFINPATIGSRLQSPAPLRGLPVVMRRRRASGRDQRTARCPISMVVFLFYAPIHSQRHVFLGRGYI